MDGAVREDAMTNSFFLFPRPRRSCAVSRFLVFSRGERGLGLAPPAAQGLPFPRCGRLSAVLFLADLRGERERRKALVE